MSSECCNKIIFERTLNNKLSKRKEYEGLFNKYKISLESFDHDEIDKIISKNLEEKKTLKQLLEEYVIIHLSNLKCFCLVMAFPFYSFENEHENLRRKHYHEEKGKNIKPTISTSDDFFLNVDLVYIFKRSRFNDEYLT